MKKLQLLSSAALAAHMAAAPAGLIMSPRADAGQDGELAKALADLKSSMGEMRSKVMKDAETALAEAKKSGEVSAELKASIDELLPKFNASSQAIDKIEAALEAIDGRTGEVEQLLAEGGGRRGGADRVSAGREVAEGDRLKAYVQNGRSGAFEIDVKAAITTATGSGGGMVFSDRETDPVEIARRQLRIRSLLNVVSTGANSIEYSRQTTRTNAAAPVAEEGVAPESDYGWTKTETFVRKIAHVTHISEEALSDAGQLQGEIDGELSYGLDLVEETQILTGSGTGENLSGLITNATAFSAAAGLPNTQALDRLRLAILQVTLNDYAADAIVLNPTNWAGIELLKDSQNRYLFGIPGNPGEPALWRLPVVESNSMTVGTWLVGAMRMAATLYDRQENTIRISSEHGTNFVEGMLTMKGQKRVALAVKRQASLVTGNLTFA